MATKRPKLNAAPFKTPAKLKVDTTYHSQDGTGRSRRMPPPSKDWSFRKPGEERVKPLSGTHAKRVVLKSVIWSQNLLVSFFRNYSIIADETDWFITYNGGKLTNREQLKLMIREAESSFDIQINLNFKHLVIE